jgi:hypothetical protein
LPAACALFALFIATSAAEYKLSTVLWSLMFCNFNSSLNFSSPKLSIESHDLESIANKIARV